MACDGDDEHESSSPEMHGWLQAAKVVATMIGHTDRVNCVQWLPTSGEAHTASQLRTLYYRTASLQNVYFAGADAGMSGVIASGAADNHIIIWLSHADKPNRPWSIAAKLQVQIHPTG